MPTYEYRLLQMPKNSTIGRFNEQIRNMVADGWEPLMLSGDVCANILFRREASAEQAPEHAVAAAAAQPVA